MIAAVALLVASSGAGAQGTTPAGLRQLRARREWLYNATHEREDSGYFDFGEASPDGVYFALGASDRLYYLSLFVDEEKPQNDRCYITCWVRRGDTAKRAWQVKLLPGRRAVRGTLLRHACATQFQMSSTSRDAATGKTRTIEHKVSGFHPDRAAPEWKIAGAELERGETYVHYHFNWHGDASLGNYVDLHRDMDVQSGGEPLDSPGPPMRIPKLEVKLLRRTGRSPGV